MNWFLRAFTYLAVMVTALSAALLAGAMAVWLAYVGRLADLVGVTWAVWIACTPMLIVFAVFVWWGAIWRKHWLQWRFNIWTD